MPEPIPEFPHYDELSTGDGRFRGHWREFLGCLGSLGPTLTAERWEAGRRLLRQHGVTYNVYGNPQGLERPWPLDMVPLLLPYHDWEAVAAGVEQRARLLNLILGDLYGPQTLVRSGRLPPSLLYADPGFKRPCHGLPIPGERWLHFFALDLGRGPDGRWWVLGSRTNIPSGAGYALENRVVLSQVLPEAFRVCQVSGLTPFFSGLRDALLALAPRSEQPRGVLLSPGPYNETYFEHAFLARQLGFTLVEGEDITVRDGRVFLKTLSKLEQVDVIFRRLDDDYCDPLELRADSALGVAGLMQAVREGGVVVANAVGSSLLESASFEPFLPSLCRHLLGEELRLPGVATWWCGQESELRYVLAHLDTLVIRSAHGRGRQTALWGAELTRAERVALRARILACPWAYVGQERMGFSVAPVRDHDSMVPRPVLLRAYAGLAEQGDGYTVMPGGLTRVANSPDDFIITMASGGGSKDTWVLREMPQRSRSGSDASRGSESEGRGGELRPIDIGIPAMTSGDLPSRVADGLFWLGRYAERCEGITRLLRSTCLRLVDGDMPGGSAELRPLLRLLFWVGLIPADVAQVKAGGRELVPALRAAIFDLGHPNSLRANVQRLYRSAHSVRDRLSRDMWQAITRIDRHSLAVSPRPEGIELLQPLDDIVTDLSALFGLEQESMVRGPGWRFLTIGRRLERAVHSLGLTRGVRAADLLGGGPEVTAVLDVLLELGESSMSYRERYLAAVSWRPVLEMLLTDLSNPRSVVFQVEALREQLTALQGSNSARATVAMVDEAFASLQEPDLLRQRAMLRSALDQLSASLPEISNLLANAYFRHALARSA